MTTMSIKPGVAFAPPEPRSSGAIRWTREAVARIEKIGILPAKFELLDGDIISKMGQGIPHRRAVSSLLKWVYEAWDHDQVQTQATIDVSPEDNPTNAPEPDIAVLNRPLHSLSSNPGPESIVLVIEVSDSTLLDDLTKKASLYARARIPEYWVFDVASARLHIHRNPVNGVYQERTEKFGAGDAATLSKPSHRIPLAQILA